MSISSCDYVVVNANIYTVNDSLPWVEAMAVKNGRIVEIGTKDFVLSSISGKPDIIDMQGKMLMPGMLDVHSHFVIAGRTELYGINFGPTATLNEIIEYVRKGCEDAPLDRWVVGGVWGSTLLEQITYEHRVELDKASGGRPVMLRDDSHHNRWLNGAGLDACGITKESPDPVNGTIVRCTQTGELTGLLLEAASGIAEAAVAKSLESEPELDVAAAKHAMARMNALGVTGLQDALTLLPVMAAVKSLSDRDEMTLRVVGSLPVMGGGPLSCEVWGKDIFAVKENYRTDHFYPDFGKIFLDGVPTSRTAAMLEPYLPDNMHGCCFRGATFLTVPQLAKVISECEAEGLSVKIHCAGDGSARAALDAYEVVKTFNGREFKHQIAHAGYIHDEDISRMRELNVSADLSPLLWCPGVIVEQLSAVLSQERVYRSFPNKSMHEEGVLLAVGSDWPVVPDPNPWFSMQAIITRADPSGEFPGELWPEQGLTISTAIRAYTLGPATAMGLGSEAGSLEVGKSADFIVLDRNVFDSPVESLAKTKVLQTYYRGALVYESQ